jgi:hypothetical protein
MVARTALASSLSWTLQRQLMDNIYLISKRGLPPSAAKWWLAMASKRSGLQMLIVALGKQRFYVALIRAVPDDQRSISSLHGTLSAARAFPKARFGI